MISSSEMSLNESIDIQWMLLPYQILHAFPVRKVDELPVSSDDEQAAGGFIIGMESDRDEINAGTDFGFVFRMVRE